jgi:protein tyrosine/serine phosphatase
MRRPALVHCKSGADRAGIASALFVLIEGGSVAEARRQLSLRFGHIRQSNTGILDAFLDMYEEEGSGMAFLDWVRDAYHEQALRERYARETRNRPGRRIARFVNDRLLARE